MYDPHYLQILDTNAKNYLYHMGMLFEHRLKTDVMW